MGRSNGCTLAARCRGSEGSWEKFGGALTALSEGHNIRLRLYRAHTDHSRVKLPRDHLRHGAESGYDMSLSVINRGRPVLVLAVVILTLAATGEAQSTLERFQLFNNCQPMDLFVEGLDSDATGIGLTEQSIQNVVESRLRSARLYDPNATPYLYANVTVTDRAFVATLSYTKWLDDPVTGLSSFATTWDTGAVGSHGRDANFILSTVSRQMDEFLVEYLRVNDEAC